MTTAKKPAFTVWTVTGEGKQDPDRVRLAAETRRGIQHRPARLAGQWQHHPDAAENRTGGRVRRTGGCR